jgi:hypothetical protein
MKKYAKDAKVGTVVESILSGYKFRILKGRTYLGLIRVKCLKTKRITAIDPHIRIK